ncbi:hypothetical protein [Methanosalsum natronophilum]|uniref:hypothetical protein n=1 Tax=Methanosalsum natronophilum TaxID=768733 RepID=UPI002168F01E|nr:hypothetical protein [Methanosalsum natronophilum]MCS3924111.1 hypothetical protein [Methanosalsum natronophilum]
MPEIRKLQKNNKGQYWLGVPVHLIRLWGFEKGQPFNVSMENNKLIISPATDDGRKPKPATDEN